MIRSAVGKSCRGWHPSFTNRRNRRPRSSASLPATHAAPTRV